MRVPKYRKHSTRDYAFVEWKGKRHTLPGKYDSEESRRAYSRFLRNNVIGGDEPLARVGTVRGAMLRFLDHARDYYPEGKRSEYQNCRVAIRFLTTTYGDLALSDFGPLRLQELQRSMAKAGKSRTYINQCIAKIKRAFRWCASQEIIKAEVSHALDTVEGLKAGRTTAREPDPVLPVEWEAVAAVLPYLHPLVRSMLMLQYWTGVRSGSLVRARAEQFDTTGEVWLWRPRHKMEHKGIKLIVPVGPRAQHILAPFMGQTGYLFNPCRVRRDRQYNELYTAGSYRVALVRAQERAGVDPLWTPHQLRHARLDMIRERYGIEAAQASSGHTTLDAVQLYARKRLTLAIEIAAECG